MADLTIETSWLQRFRERGLKWVLAPGALVILYLFFGLFGRNYFSYPTLVNIIDAAYYIGFISMGVTFVIISGGIDLSIGTVMMCSAIIGGTALKHGFPMVPSLLLIIAVGLAFGFLNGLLVSRLEDAPVHRHARHHDDLHGLRLHRLQRPERHFPHPRPAGGLVQGHLPLPRCRRRGAVPTGALLLASVAVICHLSLNNTKLGRYTYAIGSNLEAARLSGVDVKRWQMLVYVIAGGTAGIGGISYAAIYTTVLPAQGQGFELNAIAAAVIGGTSLAGGIGTIWGTIIGVFIMSVLATGLAGPEPRGPLPDVLYRASSSSGPCFSTCTASGSRQRYDRDARADVYKASMAEKIVDMKRELALPEDVGDGQQAASIRGEDQRGPHRS